ncbi:MAG: Sec-independent protein translocase protein TatB [Burkholderiales bacterium]|nr:Sec-independent protein translocase protein TatB [Burkholderiales bacterium]
MFDMSFSEIAVIGVVALVVLGPERLPKVARSAGHLFGRLQRYVATVKADINREMDTSELAKIKQEVQDAAKSFEQSVQQQASIVERETAAISQSVDLDVAPNVDATAALSSTQSDMLRQQEDGLSDVPKTAMNVDVSASTPTVATRVSGSPQQVHSFQGNLDFGIEPVRVVKQA